MTKYSFDELSNVFFPLLAKTNRSRERGGGGRRDALLPPGLRDRRRAPGRRGLTFTEQRGLDP